MSPGLKIGDETFIIAALMAMRHPKSTVLSGALSALVVMTVGETDAFAVCSSYLVGYNGFKFGLTDPSLACFAFQVLSTGLGRIVPNLISRKHTNSAATGMTNLTFILLC